MQIPFFTFHCLMFFLYSFMFSCSSNYEDGHIDLFMKIFTPPNDSIFLSIFSLEYHRATIEQICCSSTSLFYLYLFLQFLVFIIILCRLSSPLIVRLNANILIGGMHYTKIITSEVYIRGLFKKLNNG